MRSNVPEWTHVLHVNIPCSHLHSFCANGRKQRPSNEGDLYSSVTVEAGRVYYMGIYVLIQFFYRSTWLLLGSVLNSTPCINYLQKIFTSSAAHMITHVHAVHTVWAAGVWRWLLAPSAYWAGQEWVEPYLHHQYQKEKVCRVERLSVIRNV
jgi:hypothetical protein